VIPSLPSGRRATALAAAIVTLAAIVPYLPSLDDYFVRDDFGVVQLLSQKPANYFPKWFYSSWMDFIWGYTPDEIRPFPALSYQLTSLGGRGSPLLHHALNILLHAANGVLVLAVARRAASLSLPSATFAALVFVLLPVQTESVAWITGRVDSMPAFFYLASFLAYVRWRREGAAAWYAASLAIFFVALFTKQNTITMVATIAAYDLLVLRLPLRRVLALRSAPCEGVWPYLPFATLTAGYLWLRYLLFGQVAREGSLNAQALHDFAVIFARHVTHVVVGDLDGSRLMAAMAVGVVCVLAGRRTPLTFLYFGPLWWVIGVAPVLVAGYSSPRHVYLAAAGWAIALGIALDDAVGVPRAARVRRAVAAVSIAVLVWYSIGLARSVREWGVIADVSHKAVLDLRSSALTLPEGSLVIAGAPRRSWEWALPFAVRPPFVRTELDHRVFVISPRELSCCQSQWFAETRRAIERWSAGGARDTALALRWHPVSGEVRRADSGEAPQLATLVRALLDMRQPDELDANLRRLLDELVH
jgi:hypothetical protein